MTLLPGQTTIRSASRMACSARGSRVGAGSSASWNAPTAACAGDGGLALEDRTVRQSGDEANVVRGDRDDGALYRHDLGRFLDRFFEAAGHLL